LFLMVLDFELRALCLLGRCSATWIMAPGLKMRVSQLYPEPEPTHWDGTHQASCFPVLGACLHLYPHWWMMRDWTSLAWGGSRHAQAALPLAGQRGHHISDLGLQIRSQMDPRVHERTGS
jgi:hypothetical protein